MEYLTDNEINKAQSHNFSIAPNKTVEILLNTECQKLQVIDYGVSFKPITISSLFENKELIL